MPTVLQSSGKRVLVTGANGFIAMWIIRTLLEEGYTIRGAVRSEEKGEHLRNYFARYKDKVEWIIVTDISKDGAFNEAVKGVDAIVHTASPLPSSTPDPEHMIKPAVHGTLAIMQSALEHGDNVKRVVITSSCSAIISIVAKPMVTFDETNWADEAVQAVKEKGKNNPDMVKYRASKVLAERAAWDFYNQHKSEIGWDMVALNPPHVFGPPLQKADTPDGLNSSMRKLWGNISQERSDDFLKVSYGYVDVRDVAAAHVVALQKESAGGERIIIANGATTWQATRDTTYSVLPELYASGVLQRGNPNLDKTILYVYNPEKGKRILGIKYRAFEETLKDTLLEFDARGWLKQKL